MAAFCDIKLQASNLAATKPKHVFLAKTGQTVVLSTLNVIISVTRRRLEKKSSYRCLTLQKAQFDGNQSKNIFFGAIKLKTEYFRN